MAAEDEKLEIAPERAVEVRETRKLFRLAPAADKDLGRSSRRIVIVAADTEEEAGRSHPCTTPSDAIGGIRASRSAMTWTRRRSTCSAMSSFGPSRLRSK
jgi:hypothetical protein